MMQASFICSWFAFSVGKINMRDPRGQWGIWLGWSPKISPRRFDKKWNREWMATLK